jgi:anti-sigma factor RsiW
VSETRFSDDLLRQYLLGELAENQQVEIEDRAFEDPKLLKSITALENDLIDEYVAGEIPVRKRERFETHFLAAAERKKKLAFARALHSVQTGNSKSAELQSILQGRRSTTSY